MDSIIGLLNTPLIMGVLIFSSLGYWAGWLFRQISPYKIIAWIVLLPYPLMFLINQNDLWLTIPFAITSSFGFLGKENLVLHGQDIQRWFQQ